MVQKLLDLKTLENWLLGAVNWLRGKIADHNYKDYILPLIFLKRLSDVFEDEVKKLSELYGERERVEELLKKDPSIVRFYLPENTRWDYIAKQTTNLGEKLTDCFRSIARYNPKLQGVIDIIDFNATVKGQRIINDDILLKLINILSKYRLGLNDVEPDILGRVYEYLLKKFAEDSGQSAGEFYTPREVAILIANIVEPRPGEEIYDPCCGSGGLLIKCHLKFKEKYGVDPKIKPLKFYGQEILRTTYAIAKMNIFIHDMEAEIALGDTMNRPAFTNPDGSLKKFDVVVANPMWNQNFSQSVYENDPYNRFIFGYPPTNTADWGWVQHMFASLKDNGRMAVVLDTGAVSRGSGNTGRNREKDIRKEFIERDFIEAVILLPENLFYNTAAPGIILVINKAKPQERQSQIILINASQMFEKGRPKNYLPEDAVNKISEIYKNWQEVEGISKIITKDEAIRNDYNLSPSRYVSQNNSDETLPLEDAVLMLKEAEEERQEADRKLNEILRILEV